MQESNLPEHPANLPTLEANHDAGNQSAKTSAVKKLSFSPRIGNTHAKQTNRMIQIKALQAKCVEMSKQAKITGNTLAQLCRAWTSLEETRLALRAAGVGVPRDKRSADRQSMPQTLSRRSEETFIESIPDELKDEARGIVSTRKPPEKPTPEK